MKSVLNYIQHTRLPLILLGIILSNLSFGQRYMEYLDRGVVAIRKSPSEVLVSWRLLGTDAADVSFNVYRDGIKINTTPITSSTNFIDDISSNGSYTVRAVVNDIEQEDSNAATVWTLPYHSIPLQRPEGGTTPDAVSYTYDANDCSVGDLDGDGAYEIVVKWDPTNAKDNAHDGYTGNVYLDAYRLDGTLLWRIDLGRNIRAGAHYTQFIVYDLDSDDKAEVACKTADGTKSATGEIIGNANADHRNSVGRILSGPEYLTIFNGETGGILATTNYIPARGTVSSWGDNYGNRVDRFLAGVAYLDGEKPSLIMCRGYYTRAVIAAWDWRNGSLTQRWVFDSRPDNLSYEGQGAHSLTVGDVDADGKDEIIYGACAIDDNGTGLYSTGLGHGDALHLSDMDPDRPGLEVWMVHEHPPTYGATGLEFRDAATGALIFGVSGENADIGRGVAMDVDPRHKGYEMWGSRGRLNSVNGTQVSTTRPSLMNFGIWWDGDLLRELLDGTVIEKWNHLSNNTTRLVTGANYSAASNNGTKSTPSLSADILGDWREEVIWRKSDNTELLLFTTPIFTDFRIPTLMHDPQYRLAIAWQNVGYNQPPHPGFYLGDGMVNAPTPNIVYNIPPKVSLNSPMHGSLLAPGSDITIDATIADSDGTIEKVEFFKNDEKIGEATNAPYTLTIDDVATGSYTFTVAVTDDYGTTINSKVSVLVNTLPSITVTGPAGGTLFQEGDDVLLEADASDVDGSVSNVEFYNDGVKIGEDASAPYTFNIAEVTPGTHTITAKVIDDLGSVTLSSEIVFNVNAAPVISINSPEDQDTFEPGDDINITATVSDADGTIVLVEFFLDGEKLGEDDSDPFSIMLEEAQEGTFELTAKATDNEDGTTLSTAVEIHVGHITNVDETRSYQTSVSPNPSNGGFKIEAANSFTYTVIDNVGRIREQGKGVHTKYMGTTLQPGCYVLNVRINGKSEFIRLIKY